MHASVHGSWKRQGPWVPCGAAPYRGTPPSHTARQSLGSWTFGEIGRLRSELLRAPIFAHSSSPGGRYHHSSGRAARWNDQVIHPPPPGNLVNLNECQNGANHGPPAQVHFHGLSMGDFCYEFPLIFGEIAGEARKGLPFHLCGVLRACVLLFSHTQAHAALRWSASCLLLRVCSFQATPAADSVTRTTSAWTAGWRRRFR